MKQCHQQHPICNIFFNLMLFHCIALFLDEVALFALYIIPCQLSAIPSFPKVCLLALVGLGALVFCSSSRSSHLTILYFRILGSKNLFKLFFSQIRNLHACKEQRNKVLIQEHCICEFWIGCNSSTSYPQSHSTLKLKKQINAFNFNRGKCPLLGDSLQQLKSSLCTSLFEPFLDGIRHKEVLGCKVLWMFVSWVDK